MSYCITIPALAEFETHHTNNLRAAKKKARELAADYYPRLSGGFHSIDDYVHIFDTEYSGRFIYLNLNRQFSYTNSPQSWKRR